MKTALTLALSRNTGRGDKRSPACNRAAEYNWGGYDSPFRHLETRLGVFVTTLCVFVVCLCDVSGYLSERSTLKRPMLAGSLCTICVIMQIAFLAMVWRSVRRRGDTFGPAVVEQQPRWPIFLRPIMATAWITQFAIGCLYTFLAEGAIGDQGTRIAPQFWFMRFFIGYVCAYTAYLYLLLAIDAFTNNPLLIRRLWRKRFVVDAILAGVFVSGKIWH